MKSAILRAKAFTLMSVLATLLVAVSLVPNVLADEVSEQVRASAIVAGLHVDLAKGSVITQATRVDNICVFSKPTIVTVSTTTVNK